MEQAKQQTGFEIGGRMYDVPTLDTFDMDEAQVLYEYAGCVLEDFVQADPESSEEEQRKHEEAVLRRAMSPGFKRALVHVAYQRGNRDVSPSKVREIAGKVNMLETTLTLYGGEESPPETETPSQSELSSVSATSPTWMSSDSGKVSPNILALRDETLAPTGIGG